jgi:tetratricopeptide (TPR) repeat protein
VCKSQVSVGLHAEGESALLEALRIRRRTSSTNTDVAQTLTALGKCLRLQKKNVEGEKALKQAREILGMTLDKDSSDMATTLHELGVCLTEQKRYEEAIPFLQQSLEIYRKTAGPRHPNTAATSCWLGVCKGHLGEYSECFKFLDETLSIRRSVFGPSRIEIAWVLYWRGLFLNQSLKSKKAEEDLEKAKDIAIQNGLGPDHELRNNIERELSVSQKYKENQQETVSNQSELSAYSSNAIDKGQLKHLRPRFDILTSTSEDLTNKGSLKMSSQPRPASWHAGCSSNLFAKLTPQQLKQYFTSSDSDQTLSNQNKTQTLPATKTSDMELTQHMIPDPYWFGGTLEMIVIEKVTPFMAIIGQDGGECHASNVTLTVPSGAVSTSTVFSIDIHLNSKFFPPIRNQEKLILSPLISLSPSGIEFNKPVMLSLPILGLTSQNDWKLELMMSDSPRDENPENWYKALEFNTKTQVVLKPSLIQFDAETGILFLNHFCWLCWLGNVLGLSSLVSQTICYSVFGKKLHPHKWTISTHIIQGSNYVHDELVQSLKEQGYVALAPPTPAVVGLCGQVKLKVKCDNPWYLCMGPAEAHIPTKRIWKSPVNGASYFTVTMSDPSKSMDCLECQIVASFSGEKMDSEDQVVLLVSHPLEIEKPRPSFNFSKNISLESSGSWSTLSTPTPPVITVNRNHFTFNHSKGLAFGSNARISIEQLGSPDVDGRAGEFAIPKVKLTRESEDQAESFGEVFLSESCQIDPDYILVGVETLLTLHLCLMENEVSDLSVTEDSAIVQFISCGEEDVKFEERKGRRVDNNVLTVVSPGWPFPDRLLVRILTLNKKQIATTFINVENSV